MKAKSAEATYRVRPAGIAARGLSHRLPVDSRHSDVLGYRRTSRVGAAYWAELDWDEWWVDGPEPHMFNPGGFYLQVRCVYDPNEDGPNPKDRRTYRVRCWYAGGKYRGRPVRDIGITMLGGKLHWIVRLAPTEHMRREK